MTTTALTTAQTPTRAIGRWRPLVRVMAWELRRFRASRLFWIQALCFFGLVLFAIGATATTLHFSPRSSNGSIFAVYVPATSIWILLTTLYPGLLLLLGLLLPFVNADGVTRDVQRRTHELLMASALPSWAYVLGRYLTGLLVSLGLALMTLAAIFVMDLFLHLTVATDPLPPTGAVLLLWVGMIVSATILLSSVSFALGTLLPRQSTLVKISMLLVWVIVLLIIPSSNGFSDGHPAWYNAWDPTSAATVNALLVRYFPVFQSQSASATTTAQMQRVLVTVANTVPAIGNWVAPHLIEAGLSLLLVLVVALVFKRSRDSVN